MVEVKEERMCSIQEGVEIEKQKQETQEQQRNIH